MIDQTYRCARCNEPMEGEAASDPRPGRKGPSYMHPACARVTAAELQAEREAARLLLEQAAPALLATCQSVARRVNTARQYVTDARAVHELALMANEVEAAVAKAEGRTP